MNQVRCGCYYTITNHNRTTSTRRRPKNQNYAWICTTDGTSSHVAVLLQHQQRAGEMKEVGNFDLVETIVSSMEFVKGINRLDPNEEDEKAMIDGDAVWMGTLSRKIFIYSAVNPEQEKQIGVCTMPAPVTQILSHLDSTFVSMTNGSVQIFRRGFDGHWLLKEPQTVILAANEPITNILSINSNVYAGCGQNVWVLNGYSGEILKTFDVHHGQGSNGTTHTVQHMAHSGIGLWVSLKNSSVICLYHTETFKHLQDINIATNVLRVTSSQRDCANNNSSVFVTALMACKGLLWVGTNVGISLTVPLPRLEGVPIISGGVNISYHAHFGPVTFLLPLLPKSYYKPSPDHLPNTTVQQQFFEEEENHKQQVVDESTTPEKSDSVGDEDASPSDKETARTTHKKVEKTNSQDLCAKLKAQLVQSPVVLRRRRGKEPVDMSRMSKTLPRSLGSAAAFTASMHSNTSSSQGSDHSGCDVYGLYGDLIFVKEDYDTEQGQGNLMDPGYETLRRSEPELAAIPAKVTTLDRRLRMKVSRPRSLDLSNWSVDSRSSSMYTSSSSEEGMGLRNGLYTGRSVSRNSSSASHKTGSDLMNICENGSDIHITSTASATTVTAASTPPSATSTLNRANKMLTTQREQIQTVVAATIKKKKNSKNAANTNEALGGRRTVICLSGGRGYINWRHVWYNYPSDKSNKSPQPISRVPNSNDAHVVMWEKKL